MCLAALEQGSFPLSPTTNQQSPIKAPVALTSQRTSFQLTDNLVFNPLICSCPK